MTDDDFQAAADDARAEREMDRLRDEIHRLQAMCDTREQLNRENLRLIGRTQARNAELVAAIHNSGGRYQGRPNSDGWRYYCPACDTVGDWMIDRTLARMAWKHHAGTCCCQTEPEACADLTGTP